MKLKFLKNIVLWFLLSLVFIFATFSFYLFIKRGAWFVQIRPDLLDTGPYYMAGKLLQGKQAKNIYDYKLQKQAINELYGPYLNKSSNKQTFIAERDHKLASTQQVHQMYYYYPPNSLWLVYGLAHLPSPYAFWLVTSLLSACSLIVCLFLTFKETVFLTQKNLFYVLSLLVGIISYFPLKQNFFYGQFSLILCSAYFFYFYFTKAKNYLLAGFALSVCSVKPQIGLPLLILPILFKEYKTIFYSLSFVLLYCALGYFLIGPEGFGEYFKSTLQLTGLKNFGLYLPLPSEGMYSTLESIKGLLFYMQLPVTENGRQIILLSIDGILLLLCVGVARLPNKILKDQILAKGAIALMVFLLSPYHMIHDYCLLIFICLTVFYCSHELARSATIWLTFFYAVPLMLVNYFVSNRILAEKYGLQTIVLFTLITIALMLYQITAQSNLPLKNAVCNKFSRR
jgi:hypothetical protein